MSWFKRTKNPYGTDDYLQTAETVSRPMAIVYTIVMVFVVGALAFSIFFGGRWLYQNLDGTNQTKTTVTENPITTIPVKGETSSAETSNGGSSSSSSTGSNSSSSSTTSSGSSSTNTNTTSSSNSSSTQTQSTVTATSITATGPTEVLLVFVVSTLLGIGLFQVYIRSRI